jgi:hypothetical protein
MGEFGWTLREAIHVLAHLRGDTKPDGTWMENRTKVMYHNQSAAVELTYALVFDTPIDVTNKERGRPGEPDTYYGTELKSTSYLGSPVLRTPWLGNEALRMDETLAVMLAAVFIEPVPYGFLASSTNTHPEDKWAGSPSLIVLVGWEAIDYITHMPLGAYLRNERSPVNYVMRGGAMLPPDTHWAYLALAKRDRPPPETGPGCRWRYVREWLQSDDYKALRAQTPGLPCRECYLINKDTEGAPKRPRTVKPDVPRNKLPPEHLEFEEDLDKCMALSQKAIDEYEPLYYSKVNYPRLTRAERKRGHKAKEKEAKVAGQRARALQMAIRKVKGLSSGRFTPLQEEVYEQYKTEQRDERKRRRSADLGD